MQMRMEVVGMPELANALKNFQPKLQQKYLRRATYTAAAQIEQDVQTRAPVSTGLLKSEIAVFKRDNTATRASYIVGVRQIRKRYAGNASNRRLRRAGRKYFVDGPGYYWYFLEYGTSKMSARPFMRPAFEAQKDNAVSVFKIVLDDGVQAVAAESGLNK